MMLKLDKRKAVGPDGVSGWILRECAEELCYPLTKIYEASLNQGKLPQKWKMANIVPIFKKGDTEDPLNYRPVSLTSIVVKLLERIIRAKWESHLERYSLITDRQFGLLQRSFWPPATSWL